MEKQVVVSGGTSVSTLTFIAFLVLKLCGVINWSWWWVTAPLWIPIALYVAVALIALIVVGIIAVFNR